MKIKVQKEEKEILVQTVSLSKNNNDLLNLYLFRCPYCGEALAQIQGIVAGISEGLTPSENVAAIQQCRKCKRLYVFQTLELSGKRETRVTLISRPGVIGIFYCWNCRNPILQFMADKVMSFPDFKLRQIPFKMPCVTPSCSVKYIIADMV